MQDNIYQNSSSLQNMSKVILKTLLGLARKVNCHKRLSRNLIYYLNTRNREALATSKNNEGIDKFVHFELTFTRQHLNRAKSNWRGEIKKACSDASYNTDREIFLPCPWKNTWYENVRLQETVTQRSITVLKPDKPLKNTKKLLRIQRWE